LANAYYLHTRIDGIEKSLEEKSFVAIDKGEGPDRSAILDYALFTMRLAVRLGVRPARALQTALPYSETHDNLVFDAPLASLVAGRQLRFLRGWKQYGSCIKGFNGLGLIAEHAFRQHRRLAGLAAPARTAETLDYLRSRKRRVGGALAPVFSDTELAELTVEEIARIDLLDVALWKALVNRPIVCSTSSNMGISLHEALRFMQRSSVMLKGKSISILNEDEGWLVIWCPDEQADFMNAEKTETLRALEDEQPPLTVLHTYINRKQRDPGALKDALDTGGYFFPTNPQSKSELQNLLMVSLQDVSRERQCSTAEILADPKVKQTLGSLGCVIDDENVIVRSGVEGGLYGLMVGYLCMLEETLSQSGITAIATWNQASIGAALAAEVLADMILRRPEALAAATREELKRLFPAIGQFLETKQLGKHVQTRIHGVFDLANLQSLAQLLGVVVERHLSGRGTAFVGLGSSSYANGNGCYDVLQKSIAGGGPFQGKATFHPATHTLNPIAQALVFADDFHRAATSPSFAQLDEAGRIAFLSKHTRKPEPAGAAALAGYLLARLDQKTLSVVEIAYALRLAGFSSATFQEFAGFHKEASGTKWFLQEATEEGPYMEQLARTVLQLLDWDLGALAEKAEIERAHSRLNYRLSPLDPDLFETADPVINICLTGDNTRQPRPKLLEELLAAYTANRAALAVALDRDSQGRSKDKKLDRIGAVKLAFAASNEALSFLQRHMNRARQQLLQLQVDRKVDDLVNRPHEHERPRS
jgi:hypothetical protein